jgi:ElaB/YqjD/DUF883 family membrane-anchored ribosome-binding protein
MATAARASDDTPASARKTPAGSAKKSATRSAPKTAAARSAAKSSARKRIVKRAGSSGGRSREDSSSRSSISDLETIIRSLEARIAQLTSGSEIRSTVSGAADHVTRTVSRASHQMGDMVADTLTDVADRFRTGATSVTNAAQAGTGAVKRIGAELERRPFMTVAIALGIGFLAGLAGRRDQA